MHTLLVTELNLNNESLVKVLHYDGTPITARFIVGEIHIHLGTKGSKGDAIAPRKETA